MTVTNPAQEPSSASNGVYTSPLGRAGLYLMLYAAAIRLRYTHPELPRSFRIPGGNAGMWAVAGTGFAAVAFALVLSFVPPAQLPVGSPGMYVGLVAAGLVVFTGAPVLLGRLAKPSWRTQ